MQWRHLPCSSCPRMHALHRPITPCTQELLESPHLSLELVGLMDVLPKNLDKVTQPARQHGA